MWKPWVAHHFHLSPEQMIELSLSQYIEMKDAAKEIGSV